ncbi:hypothetical protein ACNSTQ_01370 [Alkalihalobacterium sp. APHAB7]
MCQTDEQPPKILKEINSISDYIKEGDITKVSEILSLNEMTAIQESLKRSLTEEKTA